MWGSFPGAQAYPRPAAVSCIMCRLRYAVQIHDFQSNYNSMNRRIAAPGRPLSPRFAALLRESWWLLVVAFLAYLALVLATYARSDAGWSYSGNGNAIVNKGGVVGAWI